LFWTKFVFGKEYMKKRLVDRIPFAKIMLALAVALILSIGSCGLSFYFSSAPLRDASGSLALIGLIGFLGSLAGLVLTCLIWAILAIVGSAGGKVSQPQKLLDGEDDTKLDKRE
jgi:hypothetical protein